MSTPEAKNRAREKYNSKRDRMTLRPSKELGAEIRKAAESAGVSTQAYIFAALSEIIGRDITASDEH